MTENELKNVKNIHFCIKCDEKHDIFIENAYKYAGKVLEILKKTKFFEYF